MDKIYLCNLVISWQYSDPLFCLFRLSTKLFGTKILHSFKGAPSSPLFLLPSEAWYIAYCVRRRSPGSTLLLVRWPCSLLLTAALEGCYLLALLLTFPSHSRCWFLCKVLCVLAVFLHSRAQLLHLLPFCFLLYGLCCLGSYFGWFHARGLLGFLQHLGWGHAGLLDYELM